jgi:hypothetical protein
LPPASRREDGKTKHQGLDAGSTEVSGFDPGRGSAQAAMEARHDDRRLVSKGRPHNFIDLILRSHDAMAHASRASARAHQSYRA